MKDLIDYISKRLDISNKPLIEKDIILHRILLRLSKEEWFRDSFAFKGGTCLTKCYLGYYRFSEDIDFTYIYQNEFNGISQKEIRRILSKKITRFMYILSGISDELDLDFKQDKSDSDYVELGGSNKFATFKLWYTSNILGTKQFIKIQVNFVELLHEKIVQKKAKSLYDIPEEEMKLMFPDYKEIIYHIPIKCYSIKEIFYEKIRAVLTRRGIKARDFIDVFLIMKNVKIGDYKEKAVAKIRFMQRYDKYVKNLSFDPEVVLGEEEKLMLIPLEEGFDKFLKDFSNKLRKILEEV
ncbi:MAG: nucleotidyl transferase AbiEii/AbiGii toxin family protein [Candidatus Woesearchaeota archaeon]